MQENGTLQDLIHRLPGHKLPSDEDLLEEKVFFYGSTLYGKRILVLGPHPRFRVFIDGREAKPLPKAKVKTGGYRDIPGILTIHTFKGNIQFNRRKNTEHYVAFEGERLHRL